MDSSLRSERENASFDSALAASTPKSKKCQFICHVCDKTYVSKGFFERHVASHGIDARNNSEVDLSDIPTINESAMSVDFKKPQAPAKPQYVCTYCLKGYLSKKAFDNHNMMHAIQHAASKYPNKAALMASSDSICVGALTVVSQAHCSGEMGQQFRELIGHIVSLCGTQEWIRFSTAVWDILLNIINGIKFLLPSVLLGKLTDQVEYILNDEIVCLNILEILNIPSHFKEYSLCQFFSEFCMNLPKEIMLLICKNLSSNKQVVEKSISEIDAEDRQEIYYIGGSILRGYFRIANRYKSNKKWARVAQVLKAKVISDDPSKIKDAAWTLAINRGGLLFISADCQEFFVSLTKVVFHFEKPDGSIDFEQILKHVMNSNVCILWDKTIEDDLAHDDSVHLMCNVIRFFCQTCGRAFARNRLNLLREKPVVSMTTRHLVASRKNRK